MTDQPKESYSPKPVKASVVVRIYGDTFDDVIEDNMVDEIRHRLDLPIVHPNSWEGTEFTPTEVEMADGDEELAEALAQRHAPALGGKLCTCGWPAGGREQEIRAQGREPSFVMHLLAEANWDVSDG